MKFRLAAVLRARKAQEDAAKAAVVRARAAADVAAVRVQARKSDVDGRHAPERAAAKAFAAAMTSRQALAAELSVAIAATHLADGQVDERVADLTDAAIQRRTLEKLEERHATARRHSVDAAELRGVDDLTTAAYSRRTAASEPDTDEPDTDEEQPTR